MELMPIVQNDINANSVNFNSNNENINENFREENNNNYKKRIINIYNLCRTASMGLLHTLLLSIFETVFYWAYVTDQERIALLRRLDDFKFILNVLCVTLDNEELKKVIQQYIDDSDDKRKINNEGPFKTSIILIVVLFILSIMSLIITLLVENISDNELIKHDKKKVGFVLVTKKFIINIRNSIPLFIFISIYEFLFFQMVIYYYQPISTHEMITRLASDCLN